mmetsp:Transcript_6011/g.8504  ORF Transcript_6011/g.8504 Transcript_6011/m.8504 type:complete len:209 (-) Transcript_6011:49-675(-)
MNKKIICLIKFIMFYCEYGESVESLLIIEKKKNLMQRMHIFLKKRDTGDSKKAAAAVESSSKREFVKSWRMFYLASCINSFCAVLQNNYRHVPWPMVTDDDRFRQITVYKGIFYFRPRVLFTVGALLRGLQLTSPLDHLFDPQAGVGLGINLLTLFAGSRWLSVFCLGWAVSKPIWQFLGAQRPKSIRVPIAVALDNSRVSQEPNKRR